ncbi:MAG: hypothetical protein JW963_09810, partial [Anaerolineales bacterium]|nr:hypothetical protein [Anaerolineales bacterium]
RNPPIVMPLTDGSERYMVLDGANRVTSLREMGFPNIVAQVVEPDDKNVTLQTWNHIVWGMDSQLLIESVRNVKTIKLKKIDPQKSFDPPETIPVQIRLPDGSLYLAITPTELIDKVGALHGIVDCYKEIALLDRTSQTLPESFKATYPDMTALVIFPRFDIPSVLYLAGQNCVLPTGITRFTISPRALHLNYPLHELSSGKPIEYKEAYLQHWVVERIKNKGVRHYAEATFLFDE